ncbi:MAG: hypothetical protein FJ294_10435, partial [Planctomycetes bacterium]|nr:hypothetical protein [Planctomycetota bacterium]
LAQLAGALAARRAAARGRRERARFDPLGRDAGVRPAARGPAERARPAGGGSRTAARLLRGPRGPRSLRADTGRARRRCGDPRVPARAGKARRAAVVRFAPVRGARAVGARRCGHPARLRSHSATGGGRGSRCSRARLGWGGRRRADDRGA